MLYAPLLSKRNEVCDAKNSSQEMITQMITSHSMTLSTMRNALKNTATSPMSASRPEDGPADADDRQAFLDRDLEVFAHAHRQMLQAGLVPKLAQPPEMLSRVALRGDGHQSD